MRSKSLVSAASRGEIEYHLAGLVEAGSAIGRYARILKGALGSDLEKTARVLSQLEVEIFFHLDYHMKQLRMPFTRLHNLAYKHLDEVKPSRGKQRLEAVRRRKPTKRKSASK